MTTTTTTNPRNSGDHNTIRGHVPHTYGEDKFNPGLVGQIFLIAHLVPLLAIFTGVTWFDVGLLVGLYFGRMFFVTAGYHRYFSHRSYKMGRVMQFIIAVGAMSSSQKGVNWWASHHRHHHKYSDTPLDTHSPNDGFWWSHYKWFLCEKYFATLSERIPDLEKFPELRFLDRYHFIVPAALGVGVFLLGGWRGGTWNTATAFSALFIGFFLSTVILWHGTYTINSLAHRIGRRRYATADTSRNSALLTLITMGEGWHNNHHHYQSSTRQGFYWWEFDPTYYILKFLSLFGLVRDLRPVPEHVLDMNRLDGGI